MIFPVKVLVYMIGKMFSHGNQGNPSNHGRDFLFCFVISGVFWPGLPACLNRDLPDFLDYLAGLS